MKISQIKVGIADRFEPSSSGHNLLIKAGPLTISASGKLAIIALIVLFGGVFVGRAYGLW